MYIFAIVGSKINKFEQKKLEKDCLAFIIVLYLWGRQRNDKMH